MHIPIEIQKFAVYCCIDIFSPFMKLFTKFLSQYGRSKYCSKFENIIAFLVHIIYCLTLFVFYNNISKFIYDFTINTLRCMTRPKSCIPGVLEKYNILSSTCHLLSDPICFLQQIVICCIFVFFSLVKFVNY